MELSLERFGEEVAAVVASLPEPLQPFLDRFEFDVSETPPADDPDLGVTHERLEVAASTRWGSRGIVRITVYKAPFERAEDEAVLRDWLREAILEELTGGPDSEDDGQPRPGGADLVGGVDIRG